MPLPELGTCGHCQSMWGSKKKSGRSCVSVHIPTCEEGAIMAVCEECFTLLPSEEIIRLAVLAYKKSNECLAHEVDEPGTFVVEMPAREHELVEARIAKWVRYMKGEVAEKPFSLEAFKL